MEVGQRISNATGKMPPCTGCPPQVVLNLCFYWACDSGTVHRPTRRFVVLDSGLRVAYGRRMDIVYNASAGTGKTWQVTALYQRLVLDEGVEPHDILLMTFTENAAAELRARVAHRLFKARRTAGADETVERAMRALSQLPAAPICTIHSFCTRLLREHALEAGLSPGFAVLEPDESNRLLDDICRSVLLEQLGDDPDFRDFCAGTQIIGTARGSGITGTVPQLISEAGSLGIALEHAETMLPDPQPPIGLAEFQAILAALRNIPRRTKKVDEAIDALEHCMEQASRPPELVELFDRTFSGHFAYGEARPIYARFKELKQEVVAREQYRERFPAAKAFARHVQQVALRFRDRKHAMDAVDFDDQLRLAARLLADGQAAPEFRHVIVDEVQDTSRIQCDIIRHLWKEGTSLVICGDRKQSIYTWRGADPHVMPDLEQLIREAGGKRIDLQTSYRSKAPILDVVNPLFEAVYEGAYAQTEQLHPHPGFAVPDEKRCVEFLAYDGEAELSRTDRVAAEMEAVARRIRLLVGGAPEWRPAYRYDDGFHPAGDGNAYRFSDILILLRRTLHQPALEQALRNASIPYTLGGKGRGLFSRQETRDLSLFLNTVTNPQDAFSLIGFLRSPWIGLSDEEIAGLAWSNGGFSIDHLMARHAEKTGVVDRYRALAGTLLASEMVRQLVEETAYDALLAGLPNGTQRLANLRKVIDWLRETERGAQTTPAAVARILADHVRNPPDTPEATLLDPAQNAVTIMTVHGAKGLTSRVVFLPDIGAREPNDSRFCRVYFDDAGRPALGVRIDVPAKSDSSAVKSPGFEEANRIAAGIRKHESKNLFYVAMTRARDLVVASATTGVRPGGWLVHLEPLLGHAIRPVPYSTLPATPTVEQGPSLPDGEALAAALASLPPPPPPPAFRRIPATRLAHEDDEDETFQEGSKAPARHAAALGSLGHAVLEQLALNGWAGSVDEWIGILHGDFLNDRRLAMRLAPRIEATRSLMAKATAGMRELRPEFPFLLHDGDLLVDGTIDLLCHGDHGAAIFDYKFTEEDDEAIEAHYRGQMELYRKAAARALPGAGPAAVHLVAVSTEGPRLVPMRF